jgi:nucleotide-binding universal stress UspA family protein
LLLDKVMDSAKFRLQIRLYSLRSMPTDKIPLLLVTNGSPQCQPALDYGVWLAEQLKSPVRLLGILESKSRETLLNKVLSTARKQLEQIGVPYDLVLQRGGIERLIPRQTEAKKVLAVVGPLGRSMWSRALLGRSMRRILHQINAPLLYTRTAPNKLENILLCVGGMEYSLTMVELALDLAAKSKPQVNLLHIVTPHRDFSSRRVTESNLLDLLQADTPEARNLQAALDLCKKRHLKGRVVVRKGSPADEIIAEAKSGRYDLVGMGSLYGAKGLRQLATADVSAHVAENLNIPILIARTRAAT